MSLKTLLRLLQSSYKNCAGPLPFRAYHMQTTHAGQFKQDSPEPILYTWKAPSIHQPNTIKDTNIFQSRLLPNAPISYILPSPCNGISKKTILDPLSFPQFYQLPTKGSLMVEKFSPPWQKVVPVEAPSNNSSTEKLANKFLLVIRGKKIKKHKLKRFRKKMMFLNRSLTQNKKRRKEKELLMYEKEWLEKGEMFNPEAFVDKQIELAKKGNWSVDVLKDWKKESIDINEEHKSKVV